MASSAFSGGGGGGGGGSLFPSDNINWKSFGMDITGVNDSTAGLQAYVDAKLAAVPAVPPGGPNTYIPDIVLPPGYFKLTSPLLIGGTTANFGKFGLRGAPGATLIFGSFPDYLIKKVNLGVGVGPSYIKDIHFLQSDTTAGTGATGSGCLDITGQQGLVITDCAFTARGGVCINFNRWGVPNTYGASIRGCLFTGGSVAATTTAIGIVGHGQVAVLGCDFTVFSEAIRLANTGYFIGGSRFEVNKTAINLGTDYLGNSSAVSRLVISGISMEANDVFINIRAANNFVISGVAGQGSAGSPAAQSQNGLILANTGQNSIIQGVTFNGTFANNAIQCASERTTFINCGAANSFGGGGTAWSVTSQSPPGQFIYCNYNIGTTIYPFVGPGVTNAQVAQSYTVRHDDNGKVITVSNVASVTVTLPTPGTLQSNDGVSKQMMDGFSTIIVNLGTGLCTITPTASTIDGVSSVMIRQYESVRIFSDGTNYFTGGHSGRAFGVTITPTALSGDVNNYNPTGLDSCFTVRQDGGGSSRNITGLSGGRGSRVIRIVNIGANNLVLKNSSGSSSSGNQFLLTGDWTLTPNQVACVQYDSVSLKWRPYQGGP